MRNKDHCLLGKVLIAVQIAKDRGALKFDTEDGSIVARAEGDCCSRTWVEHVELPALGFPAKVLAVDDAYMPSTPQGDATVDDYGECIAYYGCKITTDKGDILIDYRNSSNGYYGGDLSWPDDRSFYGGVFGQNISKEEWTEIQS